MSSSYELHSSLLSSNSKYEYKIIEAIQPDGTVIPFADTQPTEAWTRKEAPTLSGVTLEYDETTNSLVASNMGINDNQDSATGIVYELYNVDGTQRMTAECFEPNYLSCSFNAEEHGLIDGATYEVQAKLLYFDNHQNLETVATGSAAVTFNSNASEGGHQEDTIVYGNDTGLRSQIILMMTVGLVVAGLLINNRK